MCRHFGSLCAVIAICYSGLLRVILCVIYSFLCLSYLGAISDRIWQEDTVHLQDHCSRISEMDDSGCDVVLQRNEINGNFAIPRQLCQPYGEDEVDSSRVMIPLGEDESDGSPSKTLPCSIIADLDLDRLGKAKNDNDDEGYYSQELEKHRFASIQRDEESTLNNNICPSLDPSLSGDANGKVLGVSMPPNYIIRSNQRRTSFSPNENRSSQQLDNAGSHVGVQVRAIPSRLSLEDSKAKNLNTPYSPRSDSVLNRTSVECYRKDTSSENVSENSNQRTLRGLKRKCEDEAPRPLGEAGVSISPRKRKERDEDDGGDDDGMITPMSAEPDTKRMRTADAVPRQYSQGRVILMNLYSNPLSFKGVDDLIV